ncbi:MAG: UbiX family flavin prenyltransferase [Bacteroidota bacterium]|jgi:4-hydroxy-3-polyprenylbenzoate decarboxylase|nr:UbiX family flavin prenyltransferase [Bacteroidales bacterium]MDI9535083.1 UbiX family flavin prenyltransferase [Bacteroidota bacterium]NLP20343.1 UbiX family flavin prenyltransferase [Bacteroidales bacterium]HPX75366.1 UbiX family flavin prenyltransferase [Bacteroidales bacterium]
MDSKKKNILVAITGASGAIYAKQLLEKLNDLKEKESLEISVIYSKTGKEVAIHEIGYDFVKELNLKTYEDNNFYAPFASGSSPADILVIAPCSMGTLGRIANGFSDSLITRAADVVLKERKKLILLTRETPLNLIHIKNMELISLSGGIIFPASPSFYNKPTNIEDLVNTVIFRILDLMQIEITYDRWGKSVKSL